MADNIAIVRSTIRRGGIGGRQAFFGSLPFLDFLSSFCAEVQNSKDRFNFIIPFSINLCLNNFRYTSLGLVLNGQLIALQFEVAGGIDILNLEATDRPGLLTPEVISHFRFASTIPATSMPYSLSTEILHNFATYYFLSYSTLIFPQL